MKKREKKRSRVFARDGFTVSNANTIRKEGSDCERKPKHDKFGIVKPGQELDEAQFSSRVRGTNLNSHVQGTNRSLMLVTTQRPTHELSRRF